mmetsp:Transcript_67592/g.175095  ORF Transcript_67592/g.175095 Transcript_67592/m.175095 type:complete len:206 (+) Transcript_67592:851-1468(+)
MLIVGERTHPISSGVHVHGASAAVLFNTQQEAKDALSPPMRRKPVRQLGLLCLSEHLHEAAPVGLRSWTDHPFREIVEVHRVIRQALVLSIVPGKSHLIRAAITQHIRVQMPQLRNSDGAVLSLIDPKDTADEVLIVRQLQGGSLGYSELTHETLAHCPCIFVPHVHLHLSPAEAQQVARGVDRRPPNVLHQHAGLIRHCAYQVP